MSIQKDLNLWDLRHSPDSPSFNESSFSTAQITLQKKREKIVNSFSPSSRHKDKKTQQQKNPTNNFLLSIIPFITLGANESSTASITVLVCLHLPALALSLSFSSNTDNYAVW